MIIDFGSAHARKPEDKDVDNIYRYRNDPAVYSTLGGHFTGMSREDVRQWIEHHRTNKNDLVWALVDTETDECIGHCGLYSLDYRIGKAELGLAIAQSHWGKGIGGRAIAGLTNYGFRQLRLHRIETFNLALNDKIVSIKESLGFQTEGVMRDFQYRDGRYIDVMIMAILEDDWDGIPEKYQVDANTGEPS